ncbi:hypothetical protein L596_006276 [Steinernema carpocapsae]|uniref:Uncharacterized protein n=1 Tax=Steinernema carpocapsae TaxID=34508 RepID=A0A4V6I914_STECR|nr:hypothetical protein L596_006276 [Steinernema carpocapsae]
MCFYYQKCYDQIGWLRTKLFAALAEIREDASELETLDETQEEDGDRTSTSSELTGNTEESSEAIGHQRKLLTDEKATRLHNEELSRPTASTGFKNFYCSTEERMELQRKLMDSHLSLGFANIKREEVRKKLQNQFRSRVDLCWLKLGSVNRSLHFTEGVLDRLITSSMIHAANLVNSKFHFNILTALTVPPFIWQVCQNIYVQIAIACASDDNILETQPTFPVNDIPEFVGGHWDRAVQETPDLYRGFIGWVKEKKRILNKASSTLKP